MMETTMLNPVRKAPNRLRRTARFVLLAWVLPVAVASGAQDRPAPSDNAAKPLVEAVSMVGMTVADLDRSVKFFTDVLTFEKVSENGPTKSPDTRVARLRLGDELIELTQYATPKGRPFPEDTRSNDRWFQHIAIIVSDMDRAYARLSEHGVRAASREGPQRLPDWNRNAAGIRAFYFRDPDGHFLEILQFPIGKGDPKWQRKTDKLFLGIDHTAIVVGDTEVSLRFYRDALGFKVVGGSENYGPEQEKLNNVPGAHLRITTLRAPAGPAIEFLEYLNPRDGRAYPADARPSDLLHWQTMLVTRDAASTVQILKGAKRPFVSDVAASHNMALVRDPDGHMMRFVEE